MDDSQGLQKTSDPGRARPLPENIRSVQPGGGVCYQIELAWGRWRRWWLTHFWPGYVKRMAELRQGDCRGAPHEIIDSRDLKYCRNVCSCSWAEADDPFRWRRSIPSGAVGRGRIAAYGRTALGSDNSGRRVALGVSRLAAGRGVGADRLFLPQSAPPRAAGAGPVGFTGGRHDCRNYAVAHDDFVGGPAVRIGIFFSIFNVHLNRSPVAARVIALRYSPGEFLNALRPESALRNENMWIASGGRFAAPPAPGRAADFRRDRPADRLRVAARRSGPAGTCFRHDQARLADGTDLARRGRAGGESPRRAEGKGRANRRGGIQGKELRT